MQEKFEIRKTLYTIIAIIQVFHNCEEGFPGARLPYIIGMSIYFIGNPDSRQSNASSQ